MVVVPTFDIRDCSNGLQEADDVGSLRGDLNKDQAGGIHVEACRTLDLGLTLPGTPLVVGPGCPGSVPWAHLILALILCGCILVGARCPMALCIWRSSRPD